MRIAYMTTDEVNLALAVRMARLCEATVDDLRPADKAGHRRFHFDAILYDFDVTPPHERSALIAEILSGTPRCNAKAVHGYGLSEEQAETLREGGVTVAWSLDLDLIRSLHDAALRNLETVPPDEPWGLRP
jgi:hypothetical protein